MIKGSYGQSDTISYLALGDSYTIGESVSEELRWPVQLTSRVNALGYRYQIDKPHIIATTGWTTQELKAAIEEKKPSKNYDLVSLLIGVNDQYREYPAKEYPVRFRSLLNIAIIHAGGNKNNVIVLSIPDYGFTPFGEAKQKKISRGIRDYNAINKQITLEHGIKYYDITPISKEGLTKPRLVADDKLHPSGKQYTLWVDLITSDPEFMALFQ
ncbi:MAG: SGNH/GDSL hydrolase family protein [Bacteroidota bacterium]